MKITSKQYARGLYEALEGKNETEAKELIFAFLQALKEDGALSRVAEVVKSFDELWRSEKGILAAEISAAYPVGSDLISEIKEYIKGKTGAKEIEVSTDVDKNLLGGVVVKYGDRVIDGSLAGRIKSFREYVS